MSENSLIDSERFGPNIHHGDTKERDLIYLIAAMGHPFHHLRCEGILHPNIARPQICISIPTILMTKHV